jgi:hypothetical protein
MQLNTPSSMLKAAEMF